MDPKKYTRNYKSNEAKHGFIAEGFEATCTAHFRCLVGITYQIDDEPMKTVDYASLTAVL